MYAFNQQHLCWSLWEEMIQTSQNCSGEWCIAGDFNNVLKVDDRMAVPLFT